MGQSIGFKKWKVFALCLHRNILVTDELCFCKQCNCQQNNDAPYTQPSLYLDVLYRHYDMERQ